MNLVAPTHCALWEKEEKKSHDLSVVHFDTVKTYIEDTHRIQKLLKCKDCDQLYFRDFYEEVDWAGGNDPQYISLIPVAEEKDADELVKQQRVTYPALLGIHGSWPSTQDSMTIVWNSKNT